MEYITIYETFERNEVHILSNIFEQESIDYRVLDERTHDVVPIGIRLQVREEYQDRAIALLRENGFLGERLATTDEPPSGKFWIYLFIALLVVIVTGILVFWFMNP